MKKYGLGSYKDPGYKKNSLFWPRVRIRIGLTLIVELAVIKTLNNFTTYFLLIFQVWTFAVRSHSLRTETLEPNLPTPMLWKKLYGVQMCVQLHTRTTLYINMFIYLTSSLVMLHQQLYKIQLFISTFYFYFLVRLQIHIFVMKLFTIIIPRRKLCNSVLICCLEYGDK